MTQVNEGDFINQYPVIETTLSARPAGLRAHFEMVMPNSSMSRSEETIYVPPAGFEKPVAYLLYDHERLYSRCALIDRLVDNPYHEGYRHDALAVLEYLLNDLPLHVADEEDLFDLLVPRCEKADGIDAIVALLDREHKSDQRLAKGVIGGLEAIVTGDEPDVPLVFLTSAMAYAESQRRHIAWENLTVMPLAEKRLRAADMAELGRRMAARRM